MSEMSGALSIDGKSAAQALRLSVAARTERLVRSHGVTPGLAVVLVGDDPASAVYVRSKLKATAEVGMRSFEHRLAATARQEEVLALLARLNADPLVHGILVQLPLPAHISEKAVLDEISVEKDVDGFHPLNAGRLATGQPGLVACTPRGCMILLRDTLGSLDGLEAVVVGRSTIVGKPMAQLLLAENCTVTIAHSRTRDLPAICRRADIVVAAVGRPEMIRGSWLKPGATVIDVGINRVEADGRTRLVGDVAYDEAVPHVRAITPVPGGVGPMTIACLLDNTLIACRDRLGLAREDG